MLPSEAELELELRHSDAGRQTSQAMSSLLRQIFTHEAFFSEPCFEPWTLGESAVLTTLTIPLGYKI